MNFSRTDDSHDIPNDHSAMICNLIGFNIIGAFVVFDFVHEWNGKYWPNISWTHHVTLAFLLVEMERVAYKFVWGRKMRRSGFGFNFSHFFSSLIFHNIRLVLTSFFPFCKPNFIVYRLHWVYYFLVKDIIIQQYYTSFPDNMSGIRNIE